MNPAQAVQYQIPSTPNIPTNITPGTLQTYGGTTYSTQGASIPAPTENISYVEQSHSEVK